ncbi:beta-ketoacyl synthase N-terminal-like domain-containing protein [Saccharopolyspora spinosa]|uniref:thiolase family protein n=1 Tax=Saccharopolyspora spinosa TaxID=60894 RepID=UPI00031F2361|nr:beta-ketoacyl synthase N-terminal-like domain-containing protein [Saccharopolyspora spinosa]
MRPSGAPASPRTVNLLCASGLTAVATARRLIASGEVDLVIAGGVESMTRTAWVVEKPDKAWAYWR